MIGPKNGVPAEQFTLRNTSGKDIRFKGWKLAEVDNYNPNGIDKMTNMATGSQRWKERAVYQTEGGKVVCHKLGCSKVQGEVDRGEVLVVDPSVIVMDLPKQRQTILVETGIPASETEVEQRILQFFGNDPLAKDLLSALGIEDVENID